MLADLALSRTTKAALLLLIMAIAALLVWALVSVSSSDKGNTGLPASPAATPSSGAQPVHPDDASESGRPETLSRRSLP